MKCPVCKKILNDLDRVKISGKKNATSCKYCNSLLYTSSVIDFLDEFLLYIIFLSAGIFWLLTAYSIGSPWIAAIIWFFVGYAFYWLISSLIYKLVKIRVLKKDNAKPTRK